MSILWSIINPLRQLCMVLDGIAFSLLDNAYNVVVNLSSAELLQQETIKSITNNLYILIGVIAFFRLALVLVNSIIDPEKLNEKGKGLSNIFFRVVGMIIILFIAPFIFQLSYTLQSTLVSSDMNKNIIFKTLLADKANIAGKDAGKALQNIALSSLITIDKKYLKNDKVCKYAEDENGKIDYNTIINDGNCGFRPLACVPRSDGETCDLIGGYIPGEECDWPNCKKAVDAYNEMYVNENMSPSSLSVYAGVSDTIDDENVFVYNYMMFVTTFVGGFMTYIILSFAIDIAVRMFELVVLQILSPLFIATFVDPKSTQSGPFKNWISALGKSYASLYIKLAVLALMILLISIINESSIFNSMGDIGGLAKIIAVIGLLIFAKKAPKWIMDMIGIKGEDGLGGLSIGKKLGGMALAGGLATKAGRAALGLGAGAIKNAHAARKANRINRAAEGKTIRSRAHNAAASEKGFKNKANAYLGSMFSKEGAKENWNNLKQGKKDNIVGGASAMLNGTVSGLKVGWESKDLKDMNSKTSANAKNLRDTYAPGYKSSADRFGKFLSDKSDKGMDKALGDSFARSERAKAVKDENEALTNGMLVKKADGSRDKHQSPVNLGEAKATCGKYNLEPTNLENIANALIRSRIEAGTLKDVKLDSNGITFNGGIKASDLAKEKGVYNNVGAMAMESIAREAAIEKATTAKNNEDRISQANQVIAAANSQILELKGNIETTFGADAKKAFSSLESKFDEMANAQAKVAKLQREVYENPTDSVKKSELIAAQQDFEAAKTTAESIKNGGLAELIGQGSADGIFASLSERFDNVTVVNKLNEQNDAIKKSIANDINLYGADSYYVPDTKDKSEKVNYSTNPERAGEIIELMNFAKSKVDKRLDAAKEKKES